MISEDLKPGYLPKSQPSVFQLIGIALLLLIFTGGLFVAGIPTMLMAVVGGLLLAVCVRSFDYSFLFLFTLSMSLSYDVLLDLRPSLNQVVVPVNGLDFATLILLFAALYQWSHPRYRPGLAPNLRLPCTLFTLVTLFAAIYGIAANSGSMATYLRDARLFFLFFLTLVGLSWYLKSVRQLRWIAYSLVIAGVLCAIQQITRIFTSGVEGFNGVRDVSLPTQVLPMAIMFLLLYRHHGIRLYPRNTYALLITVMLIAIIVSLTRAVWLMMIFSFILGMRYMGQKRKSQIILISVAVFGLIFFVIPYLLAFASSGMNIQAMIQDRIQHVAEGNDFALQSRLLSTVQAWDSFLRSPIWGSGLGYPIYTFNLDAHRFEEAQLLHNSFLYYGIKIGAIGLLFLVWLIVAALRNTGQTANSMPETTEDQREIKAFAQSLFASAIPFVVIGPWSANLNYQPFMPFLGLVIGLNWNYLSKKASVAPVSDSPISPTAAIVHP